MRPPADLVVGLVFEHLARVADISLFATGISLFYSKYFPVLRHGNFNRKPKIAHEFPDYSHRKTAKNYRNSLFFPAKQRITRDRFACDCLHSPSRSLIFNGLLQPKLPTSSQIRHRMSGQHFAIWAAAGVTGPRAPRADDESELASPDKRPANPSGVQTELLP
jgi:hypothetical protein